jgi:hypothetical protein
VRRTTIYPIIAGLLFVLVAVLPGCSCAVSTSEGDKNIDVSMGGKLVKLDRLNFQPVSYNGQQLLIRNTAKEHTLEIGSGTEILNGDGSQAALVNNFASIAPGQTGALTLSAQLSVGGKYYLGAPKAGGKPSLRQLFICPGDDHGSGGGGGYTIPDVPDVEVPN